MAEELKEDKLVVPADKKSASKKVKVELEVDTSAKDLGPNPYARLIHLARAIDSWRIFPRIFITTYIILIQMRNLVYGTTKSDLRTIRLD